MSTAERRRHARTMAPASVTIRDGGSELVTETKNLSASGAYCTLKQFIAPMSKLQLDFQLPNGSRRIHVRCSGVVVRVEPVITEADRGHYHVAVFFTELSERDRSAIARFVRQRLSKTS